jgi:hypothetical protein
MAKNTVEKVQPRLVSHADAFAVSLIAGVAPERRGEAYQRLRSKLGPEGRTIARRLVASGRTRPNGSSRTALVHQ